MILIVYLDNGQAHKVGVNPRCNPDFGLLWCRINCCLDIRVCRRPREPILIAASIIHIHINDLPNCVSGNKCSGYQEQNNT